MMPLRLGPIATAAHAAPLARAVATGVVEQPAAAAIVGADPDALEMLARQ